MQFHFHKNGFALRLTLKQRHERTWKRPIYLAEHHTAGKDMVTGLFTFNSYVCTKP